MFREDDHDSTKPAMGAVADGKWDYQIDDRKDLFHRTYVVNVCKDVFARPMLFNKPTLNPSLKFQQIRVSMDKQSCSTMSQYAFGRLLVHYG